jgi:hypothetical protein
MREKSAAHLLGSAERARIDAERSYASFEEGGWSS